MASIFWTCLVSILGLPTFFIFVCKVNEIKLDDLTWNFLGGITVVPLIILGVLTWGYYVEEEERKEFLKNVKKCEV